MGKALAIDFGLKRTGLAISDESRTFAFGLETIDSQDLMHKVQQLILSDKIEDIALGFPKRLNNEDSHITENVRLLKTELEKQFGEIRVTLIDERFTSKMASDAMHFAGASKKQKKQKGLVDKTSAVIILQSYLGA